MDLATKVWLANEVRIWGLAATAIIGVISFAAALTHSRWQADLAAQNERIALDKQRESNEKIAFALNDAAQATAKAADAEVRLAQLTMPRGMLLNSSSAFREALKGRPDFKVQILWLRSVSDGEHLAWRITNCLYEGDGLPSHIIDRSEAIDQLPKEAKGTGVTIIGRKGGFFRFKKPPATPLDFIGTALIASAGSLDVDFGIDPSMPDDLVKIVIGPKL
jgi:hypothetical protein